MRGGCGRGTTTRNNTHPPYHRRKVQCPYEFLGIQWNLLDWTPHLNEHLLTLNGLWMYTRLCHTNAPPLNRQPQPWTLNVLLTLFSNFPCVLRPKIEWHPVPTILYLSALHHGTWRDGTIYIHFIFALHVYTCMCARVTFDLTMTRKRKYIVKILGQKANAL